jgi:two-component system, OmpR family, sensor kinase
VNTLFFRIFVSFWLAMILILAGAVAVTATVARYRASILSGIDPGEMLDDANAALRNQGMPGLKTWLGDFASAHPKLDIYIVNASGDDILARPLPEHIKQWLALDGAPAIDKDGASHARYWPYGYDWSPSGITKSREAGFNRSHLLANPKIIAADGSSYTLLVAWFGATPVDVLGADGISISLVMIALAVSAAICWSLARYISAPVTKLQVIARALASGNLDTRIDEPLCRRRDELGILAQDFNQMAARLQEQMTSKEMLIRDISHELRSPLTRLRVALGLAQRGDETLGLQLERIERDIERLDALIGQTLTLSRLSGAKPASGNVELGRLVSEIVEDARFEAAAAGKHIGTSIMPRLGARGASELLRLAIDNVVRNAIRFAPPGSRVEVRTRLDGDSAAVTVRDHGPGVPEQDLERIFEAFYRVAEARDRASGGIGLGLAITARVMALHGGGVKAANAADGGLIVELRFPAARIGANEDIAIASV